MYNSMRSLLRRLHASKPEVDFHEERIELFTHANSRRCLPTRTICQAVSNSRRRERFGAHMAGMAHSLSGNQAKMAELGMDLIEVTVDLDDLEQYCQEQGLKNTSGTRAQYAAHVLSEQHSRQKQLQQRPPLKPRFKKKKRRTR